VLFYLNFAITLLAFAWYTRKTFRSGGAVSLQMVLWSAALGILFIPEIGGNPYYKHDEYFNLIITAGLIGSLCACMLDPVDKLCIPRENTIPESEQIHLSDKFVYAGAFVYGASLVGSVAMLIHQYSGVIAALSVARVQEYLNGGILKGNTVQLVLMLPEFLYYVLIGKLVQQKRFVPALLLVLNICVFFVFTANARYPMVYSLLAFGLLLFAWIPRQHRAKVAPIAAIAAVLLLGAVLFIGNMLRQGLVSELNNSFTDLQRNLSDQAQGDFGYYKFLHDLYVRIDEQRMSFDYGQSWWKYSPMSLVPRAIWPNKPLTSVSNRLTLLVYNQVPGGGDPITTFTIFGEGYFELGLLGAFIAPFIYFKCYAILLRVLAHFRYSEYWCALLLCEAVTFFRGESPIPQFISRLGLLGVLFLLRTRPAPFPSAILSSLVAGA
jgi:oligosaccharide repeat unit polymerase